MNKNNLKNILLDVACIILVAVLVVIILLFALIFPALNINTCKDIDKKQISDYNIYEYIDPETGVHYLIHGRNNSESMGVRYNSDGTIMVD